MNSKKNKKINRETIKAKSKNEEEEPTIKEYLIIFAIIFIVIFGIYFLFEIFAGNNGDDEIVANVYELAGIEDEGFIYEYTTSGNKKVNIEYAFDFENLEQFDFRQDLNSSWILLHPNISIITPSAIPNRVENALLIKSSGKFTSFLRHVYDIRFEAQNFKTLNENISCNNATLEKPLIIFEYEATQQGVYIEPNSPNCVTINAVNSSVQFAEMVDKIMFDLTISN